jgi:hypothetical protein
MILHNKYYMGASTITADSKYLKNLSEAIAEAETYIRTHPECRERLIVKVVHIVRREDPPLTIIDVD